jgi:pimeloyl-ACP methyl ester carboxylesterase
MNSVRLRLCLALVLAGSSAVAAQAPTLEHFTVVADGHPLALWARRPASPKGTILLIHGRTWSALPDFDLQVPGESRSVLANLAARGYAAYALDLRGYGATPRDRTGGLTPRRAAEDVHQVLAWIAANQAATSRPVLLGWSNGSMVVQLVAQLHAEQLSAVILYGYPWDPGAVIEADPGADTGAAPRQRNTATGAASDFVSPEVTSPRMIAAYVAAALKSDPILAEWRSYDQFNALNPARVKLPTLLLQGEHDPEPRDALKALFARLGTRDKEWVTLMGGDHAALLEDTKPTFVDAVVRFAERRR